MAELGATLGAPILIGQRDIDHTAARGGDKLPTNPFNAKPKADIIPKNKKEDTFQERENGNKLVPIPDDDLDPPASAIDPENTRVYPPADATKPANVIPPDPNKIIRA